MRTSIEATSDLSTIIVARIYCSWLPTMSADRLDKRSLIFKFLNITSVSSFNVMLENNQRYFIFENKITVFKQFEILYTSLPLYSKSFEELPFFLIQTFLRILISKVYPVLPKKAANDLNIKSILAEDIKLISYLE